MRRREPDSWRAYEYMRRVGGFRPKESLALARAERFALDANLELQYEIGGTVATLVEKRPTDQPGEERHWSEQGWAYSEPLTFMPTPKGLSHRVIAALLAIQLWKTGGIIETVPNSLVGTCRSI